MRKKLLLLFSIIATVCIAVGISACGSSSSINGTYYLYRNGNYDYTDYLVLDGGDWTDSDNETGTYTVSGTTIAFYYEVFGETVDFVDGTVSNGVITYDLFGITYYYCKDGVTPFDSDDNDDSGNTGAGSGSSTSTQYTVTYNANGGTFSDGSETYTQTVSSGSTLTAPASPARDNYTFAGWMTSKNGSTAWSFSSDTVTSNVTLYASWSEKSASILSVDDASIDGTDILLVVDRYTDSVSLSSIVVCSSDSSWKLYYDKLGQTEIPTKIAASLSGSLNSGDNVFYIVVTSTDGTQVNLYTLTVHRSYAVTVYYYDGSSLLNSETAYTGYTFTTTYSPSITGYTFDYWKTSLSGSNKYTGETLWGNLSLYASKTANTYTVTYNVDGGDELAETTATVTYDKSYTLTVPTRTNYTFNGWYSGNTQLTDSKGKSLSVWNYTSDKTLTAKWTGDRYSVTLNRSDSDAGTVTGNGSHSYASSVTIKATTNNGYTWVGWYNSDNELVTTELSYTFEMPAENVTYTAKWTYYTLTTAASINEAGSVTEYSDTKITAGKSITLMAKTNEGYTWVGWYDGDTQLTSDFSYTLEMPAKNLNYTAKWLETTVTVSSSDTSIGTVSGLTTTNNILGNSVTVTATEVNLGYNFLGWYNGETKLSDEYTYTFTISETDANYIAEYELDSAMSNFTFTSTITTCAITGVNDSTVTEIMIPDYITSISSNVFSDCTSLESVTYSGTASQWASISFGNEYSNPLYYAGNLYLNDTLATDITIEGVTTIKNYAFYSCTSLTSVTVSNDVKSIGGKSFNNCTALTNIIIGSGVTSLSGSLLYGCSSLISITLPFVGSNADASKASSSTLFGYIFGTSSYTGGTATEQDYGSSSNITYYIPATLTTVTITGGNILRGAFYNCTSLESVSIPDSVTSIGFYAFSHCSSLTSVYYSGTASQWASIVFYDSSANPLSHAGNLYLNGTLATDITLEGITTINSYAFSYCTSLVSVTIGSDVTSIGSYAFEDCTSLESVTIGDSVTSIGNNAFKDCTSLISITIPDGVTSIDSSAFSGCSSLTSITIPDRVTSIGNCAFYKCTSLASITIPNGVKYIGNLAFFCCYKLIEVYNLSSLTITAGSTSNGYVGYFAKNVYTSKSGSSNITKQDGYIFYNDSGTYYLVGYTGSDTELTLPALTISGKAVNYSVYPHAFYNKKITSITISDSVTSIGDYAFENCTSLTSVYYSGTASQWASISFGNYANPLCHGGNLYLNGTLATDITLENITTINSYAFYNCTSLTSVTIGSGVTSIGNYAFYGCTSLESVTIGDNVTSIGQSAFYGCTSLESIIIPDSVTTISNYVFEGCTSLTSVAFTNTSDWYRTKTSGATSGTTVSSTIIANASTMATYLTSTYYNYYWYRSES